MSLGEKLIGSLGDRNFSKENIILHIAQEIPLSNERLKNIASNALFLIGTTIGIPYTRLSSEAKIESIGYETDKLFKTIFFDRQTNGNYCLVVRYVRAYS